MDDFEVTRRGFLGRTAPWAASAGVLATGWASAAEHQAGAASAQGMKVLGISCSPRKGRTTAQAVAACLDAIRATAPGIETELIDLGGKNINGCVAAGVDLPEGQQDDFLPLIPLIDSPAVRGIVIGSPVYFGNMSGLCKSLLDRFYVFHKEKKLAGKLAGAIACGGGRNGGQELTLRSIHTSLMSQQMIVVGDAPPTSHWGGTVWSGAGADLTADEFGMNTVKNLGKQIAEMIVLLNRARGATA